MRRPPFPALLAVCALASGGCLGPGTTRLTDFYVLNSLEPDAGEAEGVRAEEGVAVGVGPVTLPPHLDRPEIVTRSSPNRLVLYEFARWGEALDDNIARVIANDLSRLLPTDRAAVFPWEPSTPIEYRVEVDVARFSVETDGAVTLVARWHLVDERDRRRVVARSSVYRESASGSDPASAVAAMSRAVARLARDVATTIRERAS